MRVCIISFTISTLRDDLLIIGFIFTKYIMYADYKMKDTTINLMITTSMWNKLTIIARLTKNINGYIILLCFLTSRFS